MSKTTFVDLNIFQRMLPLRKSHVMGGPVVKPLAARAKGPGFDSRIAQHFRRLLSRAFTYGAVGSLVSRWSWTRKAGFISFRCLWIQLYNNLGQRLCVQSALAHQANHPFEVGKLLPVISWG